MRKSTCTRESIHMYLVSVGKFMVGRCNAGGGVVDYDTQYVRWGLKRIGR